MLAGDISRSPLTVDKDENIAKAFELLDRKKDTHIVVTDEGRVVGILSVKDILHVVLDRMRWGQLRAGKLYVSAIMTPNPIYMPPSTKVVDIAKLMLDQGISSVIIGDGLDDVDNVKILTKRDILASWETLYSNEVRVSEIMSRKPITIHPGTSIKHAEWILRERRISTLPVIDEGDLVGYLDARILSLFIAKTYLKKDIKHFDVFLNETTVSDVMKAPHSIPETSTILEAAHLLLRKRAKGAPVTIGDKLTGVITETDFTKILSTKNK